MKLETPGMTLDVKIRVAFFLLVSAIVTLIGQSGRELVAPDDLREAEVAREMFEEGDYVVPRLAGLPFVEKPPGFPAVVATAYRIVGRPSVGAARFTAVVFALASVTSVFLIGWRLLGIEGGSFAAAILALSQRFCRTAHNVLLDNALTAAMAITLLFTWMALEADAPDKKRRAYGAAGFSLGVSFLFKGFVGPIIFISGFLLYLLMSRRLSELRYIFRPIPIISFLVSPLSWVVPFLLCAPAGLVREFFIKNQFGRFLTGYESHIRPVYFYLIDIWPGFAPASILLPLASLMALKTRKEPENRGGFFFFALSIGPLVPLSASAAKDSIYFLPIYPALAMLVAWSVMKGETLGGCGVKILRWIIATAAIIAAGGMVAMTGILKGGVLVVALAAAFFIFAAAGCLFSIRRDSLRWTSVWITILIALGWTLWFTGPMAEADVARWSIHRPMTEALDLAGNREIVLYRPPDGVRGAASFYRNQTAREIRSPATLVARLAKGHNKIVALVYCTGKDVLPSELDKAAQAAGVVLQIDSHFDLGSRYLLVVSTRPAGLGLLE